MSLSPRTAEEWNERSGIAAVAEVVTGEGGLPAIQVTTPEASATIYLHGAQVTAWRPAGAEEVLFLSKQSRFEAGRAIRGGIPVCFPWFRAKDGSPEAPAHGVVRTRPWQLESIEQHDRTVHIELMIGSDEQTREWWPYDFTLRYRVAIGAELRMELIATNSSDATVQIAEALHTYHLVGDAAQVYVAGLDGARYLDNMDGNRAKVQHGKVIFTSQTDNAYLETGSAAELVDPVMQRRIRTVKQNSRSTVVWNPWSEGAAKMADLGDDEWKKMACVEACNILSEAVELAPGERHSMVATLSVLQL